MAVAHKAAAAAALALSLALAGCAAPPSAEELARADYGPYPGNYQQLADAYLAERLIDPDSRRVEFTSGPWTGWYGRGGNRLYGWYVCGMVNARNRFGGMAGRRPFFVLIRDGRVLLGSIKERPEDPFWYAPRECPR